MEELHVQPSELDKLSEKKKWWYYYLVTAKMIKEKEEMKERMDDIKNKGQNSDIMEFPDDFVSYAINREMVKELEKGGELE